MKHLWNHLVAGTLALSLALSPALPGLSAGAEEAPAVSAQEGAQLLDVTTGTYSPNIPGGVVQPGELYTLIALPSVSADGSTPAPAVLTAEELIRASGDALFIGSAVADADGRLTFENVRLRTAQAAVYYVTGPGLTTPFREATGISTSAEGNIITAQAGTDASASITLVDKDTQYRYNTGIVSDASGYYTTGNLAPGKYKLQVEKPGYLPYITDRETDYLDVTSGQSETYDVSIADNVGDVNNDGVRDMTDLAALLTYYGADAADIPRKITADLSYDGSVDDTDVALLAAKLSTGAAGAVTGSSIAVADGGGPAASDLRYLAFRVDTTSTVSAAAFSLRFRNYAVQPLTPQGGLMAPVDGGSVASCLDVAQGFTARLVSWQVDGEMTTLSFAVTADTPRPAGEVARFYYRPATGSTEAFYRGVFSLAHAVGLVGKDTVVTGSPALTYPGCDDILIQSLSIDQLPEDGSEPILYVPGVGRTNVLLLSATGRDAENTYPNLAGVTWALLDASNGRPPVGAAIQQDLLTVDSTAAEGRLNIVASYNGVESQPLFVQIKKEERTAASVRIRKDGQLCREDDEVTLAVGCDQAALAQALTYAPVVYDQYGEELPGLSGDVRWYLSGAPAGVTCEGGALSLDWDKLEPGSYVFQLHARLANGSQDVVNICLTAEPQLGALIITGPSGATLPAAGESLELTYTISGLDQQGRPMELGQIDPIFAVTPMGNGIDAAKDVSGNYTLTVSAGEEPETLAGEYILTARWEEITTSFTLTLLAPERPVATRLAVFFSDTPIEVSRLGLSAGKSGRASYTAQLLDDQSELLKDQSGSWSWTLSQTDPAITLANTTSATVSLTVANTLAAGSYTFTLTAAESRTGLSVSIPVTLTVRQVLDALALSAPASLTIPTGGDLDYPLPLIATDAAGNAMPLPEDLVWKITQAGTTRSPAGVSIKNGVLIVTSAAAPGSVTVTVTDKSGSISDQADITLEPPGRDLILTLYRQITVDNKTVQSSAPVPDAGDSLNIYEGQSAVLAYTAKMVDQSTNEAQNVPADKVKWVGQQGSFAVDSKAQPGSYSTTLTAVCEGQSASTTARVNVYPRITALSLDFGQGIQKSYTLGVPAGAPKTYTATLMATIVRGGKNVTLPLSELGLADYELDAYTYYTGVYIALDKPSGTLRITVDPVAIQNPLVPIRDDEEEDCVLEMDFSYFPGASTLLDPIPLLLEREKLTIQNAFLRRGVGTGSEFVFDTPAADRTTIPAGAMSNCYALELLDQYNRPLTGQGDVDWSLTGAPKDDGENYLITLADPGKVVREAYPSYESIRRLRVAGATPPGSYEMLLTAACNGFSRSIPVTLDVTSPDATERSVLLSGSGEVTIPRYYYQFNSTSLNSQVNSTPFTAALRTGTGYELDLADYTLVWSVTDASGQQPLGVTISASSDKANANLNVDRNAQPTASGKPLRVTATVKDRAGEVVAAGSTQVALVRGVSMPTLMEIRMNNKAITRDSVTYSSGTIERTYTFALYDQYNQPASLANRRLVAWSIGGSSGTGVTASAALDTDKVPYLKVTVSRPSRTVTVNLIAKLVFSDPGSATGTQTIQAVVPLTVTVSNGDGGGGGGGSSGGGGLGDTPATSAGVPDKIAIQGTSYINATAGTASSQTYACVLTDVQGATCSLSAQSQVVWSAVNQTGGALPSGISFNPNTRTLTVSSGAAAGVSKVIITAKYSTKVTTSITVTVNVSNPTAGEPASITVNGDSAIIATQGTSASKAYTATLKDAKGVIVTIPEGGVAWSISTLTNGTVTVNFDAKTATLTVPADARPGTLNTVLTVTYKDLKATLPVTVTVNANNAAPTDVTLAPSVLRSGNKGVATLTVAQEQALLTGNTAYGGTITIIPSGGDGLSTLWVTLTASTVSAVAAQKGQSLKIQTSLGTVTLSPESLRALAARGGSTVTVALTAEDSGVNVDFSCGTSATNLPGTVTFAGSGNGNVVIRVNADGSETVVKKALVEDGKILALLGGSAQLKTATRTVNFSDTAGHWAKDAITFTAARGLFQGVSDTAFDPGGNMTRAMVVTVLHRLEESPDLGDSDVFTDLAPGSAGSWYRSAVAWANLSGIVKGTSATTFDPNAFIKREDLVTILYRYAAMLGASTESRKSLSSFSDGSKVDSWAREAMQWAVAEGLVSGKTGGLLDPGGYATRAEVSVILQRFIRFLTTSV